MDLDVAFAAYYNVRMLVVLVGKEVEREDYGAVGRVLEGYHAVGGVPGLDAAEDIFDCGLCEQIVMLWVEGAYGGLWTLAFCGLGWVYLCFSSWPRPAVTRERGKNETGRAAMTKSQYRAFKLG